MKDKLSKADLVDMEVGQFYALCRLMAQATPIEFLAIKGPANSLSNAQEQITYTPRVLLKALGMAMNILGVRIADSDKKTSRHPSDSKKLIEEIKLYWQIQIAVVSVLGFLISKIDTSGSKNTIMILFSTILLITVGAIYNIVGNYYIRMDCGDLDYPHENEIAPYLSIIYLFLGFVLGGFLGSILNKEFDFLQGGSLLLKFILPAMGAVAGLGLLFYSPRRVFKILYKAGAPQYKEYAEPLRKLFKVKRN